MNFSFTRRSLPFVLWVVALVGAAVAIALAMSDQKWLKSNVFELLPAADYDELTAAATEIVDQELGTRLLFFVGHPDKGAAGAAADSLGRSIAENTLISDVTVRVDESRFATLAEFYYPYRRQILSEAQIAEIVADAAGIQRRALARIFSPIGAGAGSLSTDPFGLFPVSLQALRPAESVLEFDNGYLWAQKDGINYILIMAKLVSPSLSILEQEVLATDVQLAISQAQDKDAQLSILKTGFSFYAHVATQSAKGEISTIGVGSLFGLLLLVISTFRSLRPLSLVIVSILAGCTIAMAVTLTVFGFVHLFTLVFGASLIGVSVDYCFHYVADDAFGGDEWTPREGLRNIFAGITLGLLTSILAYLALTVAPFPGLQQLAVFSSAGLIGAYLTLICCVNLWRRRFVINRKSAVLRFATGYLGVWQRVRVAHQFLLIAALAIVILVTWRTIDINDDISVLQAQPQDLKEQEAQIQELLGLAQAGTFLLMSAPSDEQLLQLEESVRTTLDGMIGDDYLDGYQAVSRWVPSNAKQNQSNVAYAQLVNSQLPGLFETLGVSGDATANTVGELTHAMQPLDLATWLEDPASQDFRRLWLRMESGASASIVLLFGLQDIDTVSREVANYPSVTVVNKARELSSLFGQYRARVVQVLAAAYLIILAGLAVRYGVRRAVVLLIPPVFAGILALIVISLAGEALNLFNFLAMILVLGIGIDFTLFLAEAQGELQSTMFAITLSALTTMLSFGLLSLSSTYAVHSFGLTVLIGIACAYLLSPLAVAIKSKAGTGF